MDGCPRVLKDERRERARNQPDTHSCNLNLSIASTCAYEHGYDLAGRPLFGGNDGLANTFLFLCRKKSLRIDHLTNPPKLHRRRSPPPPPPTPPHPPPPPHTPPPT